MLLNRPQPIMPRNTAADFLAHLAKVQIKLVVKHDNFFQGDFIKIHSGTHGLSAIIHKCHGFKEGDFLTVNYNVLHMAIEF